MVSLLAIASVTVMPFLGHSLSSTLVYIWSRRNPETRLSFFGFVFTAPYLPWVLMAFSLVLNGAIPTDEILGVVIGHVWYFFNDLYPPLHGGSMPLAAPRWWTAMFEPRRRVVVEDSAEDVHNELAVAGAQPQAPEIR